MTRRAGKSIKVLSVEHLSLQRHLVGKTVGEGLKLHSGAVLVHGGFVKSI